jgi:hypothetical protein
VDSQNNNELSLTTNNEQKNDNIQTMLVPPVDAILPQNTSANATQPKSREPEVASVRPVSLAELNDPIYQQIWVQPDERGLSKEDLVAHHIQWFQKNMMHTESEVDFKLGYYEVNYPMDVLQEVEIENNRKTLPELTEQQKEELSNFEKDIPRYVKDFLFEIR